MPTAKELSARISKMKNELEKLKSKIQKDCDALFKVSFKEIFKRHKKLESFAWTQYTPHWNDGDTCTFSAHTDYIYLNGSDECDSLYEIESLYKQLVDKDESIKNIKKQIVKLEKKAGENKWEIESLNRKIKELEEANLEEVEWKFEALKDIGKIMENANDEVLLDMFDYHAKVIVTKEGIETESYEHD